jgi:hypothetical protein
VPQERVVFVSHAYADRKDLVTALKSFFEKCGLGDASYFISSLGDQIAWGKHDLDQIYEHLDTARIFIDLITPTFLTRPRCLSEIGYATALERSIARMRRRGLDPESVGLQASIEFLPMLVPPLTPDDVVPLLDRRQSPVLDGPETVAAFCDQFRQMLSDIDIRLETTKFTNATRAFQKSWLSALANRSLEAGTRLDRNALRELERRHSIWLQEGKNFDLLLSLQERTAWFDSFHLLPGELQRFVLESSLYDSRMFHQFESRSEDKSALVEMMVRYSAASGIPTRPKYRLAFAAQHWNPPVQSEFCAGVLSRQQGLVGHVRQLLSAVQAGTVVALVEDEQATPDLRPEARADLLTQFARYQQLRR